MYSIAASKCSIKTNDSKILIMVRLIINERLATHAALLITQSSLVSY